MTHKKWKFFLHFSFFLATAASRMPCDRTGCVAQWLLVRTVLLIVALWMFDSATPFFHDVTGSLVLLVYALCARPVAPVTEDGVLLSYFWTLIDVPISALVTAKYFTHGRGFFPITRYSVCIELATFVVAHKTRTAWNALRIQ